MNEHPIKFAIALLMIGTFLFNLSKKVLNQKSTTEVAMFCEFVDLGANGFDLRYDETKKTIYYSDDNIKPRDIKFNADTVTFTVDSTDKKYYNVYEYNKNTKLFRQTKDSTDSKQNIGKIYCITAEEKQKQTDDAHIAYYRLKDSIEKNLKDADSAKWGDRYISKNKVCVTVNSKNSFGAYVGNKSYCATKSNDGNWKFNL
jgi:hypothetical protein